MFVSKDDLKLSYGVDLTIGEAFVNRAVPQDNLYWKNRTIYIPGAPGYYFMPIFTDLLYRCGADRDQLLSDQQFKLNEIILHHAAMFEMEQCSWLHQVAEVVRITAPLVKNKSLFEELKPYLLQEKPVAHQQHRWGTAFPSLNRADTYLLTLVSFIGPHFNLDLAIEGWYALMTYFLILDDLADIHQDLKQEADNVIRDAGITQQGIAQIQDLINKSRDVMNKINPVMANRIDYRNSLINLPEIFKSIGYAPPLER
jgi:hypothetical protein